MKKYLDFTVEELALDESFINWVKDTNTKDVEFWNLWLKANTTEVQKINKVKSLVQSIRFKESPYNEESENHLWKKINNEIEKSPTIQKSKRTDSSKIYPWVGLAAGLLALVYFTFSMPADVEITTNFAHIETINLPEGSIVDINSASTLRYDKKKFKTDRKLSLEGEAFFNVKKGSSFKVNTSHGSVEVLGTSFNVYARDETLIVHCVSGKVNVNANDKSTILAKNQKVEIVARGNHQKEEGLVVSRSDWKKGIYHYEDKELNIILDDLKRQMDVTVDIEEGLSNMKYTGSFSSSNLETALSEVCWPLDLKYSIAKKTVKIYK